MITLYELCGKDTDIRFSPTVWRVRMLLEHKGLDWTSAPRSFLDKDEFAASGCKTFPVIKDGDKWVGDSFDIAVYLDETYPEKPLMGGEIGIDNARFFNNWVLAAVMRQMFPMVAVDVPPVLDDANAAYFREAREKVLGRSLEAAAEGRADRVKDVQAALAPVRMTLDGQTFLGGQAPNWTDYCLFGPLMWAHVVSELDVLAGDDALTAWFQAMLDLHGGHARAAKTAYPKS